MKNAIKILGVALLLTLGLSAQSQPQIRKLSLAIADTEGFGVKHAIPTRYHNPGDLKDNPCVKLGWKCKVVRKGKGGHVVFASDADGWRALEAQIILMTNGSSKFYHRNMTFRQMSKQYAGNWRRWLRVMCKRVGVTPDTTLWEYFDMPPDIKMRQTNLVLDYPTVVLPKLASEPS